jgi:hypothetical protein
MEGGKFIAAIWGRGVMFTRFIIFVAGVLFLQGCGTLRALPHVTTNELARNISENTANINEAQARATNAIILKNILRARDRWPTSYSTLSGVTSSPQIVFKAGATFDPLGIGNSPLPFGSSNAEISQDNTASASYQVNPFAEVNGGENIYKPVSYEVFKQYWNGGWPKDVLLMLLVESVSQSTGDKNVRFRYEVGKDKDNSKFLKTVSALLGEKCTVFAGANGMSKEVSIKHCKKKSKEYVFADNLKLKKDDKCRVVKSFDQDDLFANGAVEDGGVLKNIKALGELVGGNIYLTIKKPDVESTDSDQKYKGAKFDLLVCEAGEELVEYALKPENSGDELKVRKYEIKLRSIDSMIYFLGEVLRSEMAAADISTTSSKESKKVSQESDYPPLRVIRISECEEKKSVPLLKVYSKGLARRAVGGVEDNYAAAVKHAGEWHYAVQRLDLSNDKGRCVKDRAGTVFSILSQLLVRSQSEDFLKAPETAVFRAQ